MLPPDFTGGVSMTTNFCTSIYVLLVNQPGERVGLLLEQDGSFLLACG